MSDRRNVVWNVAGGVAGIASSLLLLPASLDVLGAGGYGTWLICFTAATLFVHADLGVSTALVRFLAEADVTEASGDPGTFVRAAKRLLYAFAAGYPLLVAVGLWAYFHWTGIAAQEPYVPLFIAIAAVSTGLGLVGRLYISVLQSGNRFDVERISAVAIVAVRAVMVVGAASFGWWPPIVAIAEALTLFMPGLICAVYFRRKLRDRFRRVDRGGLKASRRRLIRFGSSIFVGSFASTVALQGPLYVVGAILGAADAMVYGVAIRIFQSVRMSYQWVAAPALPRLVNAAARGDGQEFAMRSLQLTRWVTLTAVLGSGVLLFAPASTLTLWLGPGYATAAEALQVTGLALLLFGLAVPSAIISAGMGYPGVQVGPNLTVAVVTLAMTPFLTHMWGSEGALLALAAAVAVTTPWIVIRTHSIAKLDLARSARLSGFIVVVGLLPSAVVWGFWREAASPVAWLALILTLVLVSTLCASISVGRRLVAEKEC